MIISIDCFDFCPLHAVLWRWPVGSTSSLDLSDARLIFLRNQKIKSIVEMVQVRVTLLLFSRRVFPFIKLIAARLLE